MNQKEIFKKLIEIRMRDSKFHDEMSRIMLVFGCRHYNREHEYYKLSSDMDTRALERFWQHHGDGTAIYIKDFDVEDMFVSKGLGVGDNFNRFDITSESLKHKLKQYYKLWEEFKVSSIIMLNDLYYEMEELKEPFMADRICDVIKCYEEELKRVRVCMMEYNLVEWNPAVICAPSYIEKYHDYYKEKSEKVKLEDYI